MPHDRLVVRPNVLMGFGVMVYRALGSCDWPFDLGAGRAVPGPVRQRRWRMAYGFLLMLTSASVWFMRNQSLFEMWWLFTTLMRYPREIFDGDWASAVRFVFSFAIPIMLVTNVPASVMVKALEPWLACYAVASAAVVLWASRRVFKAAMRRVP